MIAVCFRAMGTTVAVTATDEAGVEDTRLLFAETEARLSRFLPDSELSRLNASPHRRIEVGPALAAALDTADRLRSLTGGLVDIGVGAGVVAWGYDRSFEAMPERVLVDPTPPPTGRWSIDGTTLTRSPGTRLDLGGVAKGWTCDRAVDLGLAAMVSAGGDIRSAVDGATVDVVGPAGEVVATVRLDHGALATSTTARRRWTVEDGDGSLRPAHHLIDPRTGAPARSPVVSATVVTATAAEAEAGAKSMLLHGAAGLAWADEQPWIRGAIAVWDDGAVYATTGTELAA